MDITKEDFNIFIDGSSMQGPRRGGIGIRIVQLDENGDEVIDDVEQCGYKGANNNEMELEAGIRALEIIRSPKFANKLSEYNKVIIHSDSQYVCENYKNAVHFWTKSKWRKRDGSPVLNVGLWKKLTRLSRQTCIPVEFQWIKGHSINIHNRAADRMAKVSAGSPINPPLSVRGVRKKTVKASVSPGSVRMEGQDIIIRIIEAQYLKEHKLHRYKYEVNDGDSPYNGCMDRAISEIYLREGHSYRVTLNDVGANPRIEMLLSEVLKKTEEDNSSKEERREAN